MIEVVDVLHPTLVCDTYGTVPVGIYGAAGGKTENDVIFCGGYTSGYSENCYILGKDEPFIKMNDKRSSASGVVLPNGTFMMIGKIQVFMRML